MAALDDVAPEQYAYEWKSDSSVTLSEFLTKSKPSMVQDDGTKPWLWVRKAENESIPDRETAIDQAKKILQEITKKVESIQNDASIPIRANKKKGIKSKKELREEAQHEATERLKEVSVRHGFVSGKWLIFAPSDKVDFIWSTVATSLIEGPLSQTNAYLAKVATSPQNALEHYQHILCLYLPDVYDKDNVTAVMRILLRNHGLSLSGVKSNLYTEIGVDSKHPSGIQSTIWRNNSLMKDTEIKELRDAYFTELNASKAAEADKPATTEEAPTNPATTSGSSKTKPKLKKKSGVEDPFASDEDVTAKRESPEPKEKKPLTKGKGKKLVLKKKVDDFESDNDDEDDPEVKERVKELKSKKQAAKVTKRRKSDSDDEDEDEEPPKKRKSGRK